jgi:hypothetical protein
MNNTNSKAKTPTPWALIVIAFILFWPIGIFLLLRRLKTDKSAVLKNSKRVAIISYVLFGLGVMYAIAAVTGEIQMLIMAILCICGGFWLRMTSKKMKETGERYRKYIDLIANQSIYSIDTIANLSGLSYEQVSADLRQMIEAGYFSGAYIDDLTRSIVLPQQHQATSHTAFEPVTQAAESSQRSVVVCSSCGAKGSVIAGQITLCEYCDSPLQQ